MKKILYLTLHRNWFSMIASGKKTEEYREVKPYWTKRLEDKTYDEVHFKNGYHSDAPFMRVVFEGLTVTHNQFGFVYVIKLGKILEIRNFPPNT